MPQAVKISTNVISGSINKNGVSFNIEGAGRNFGSLDGGNWYSNVLPDDGRWVIISESKGSGKPAFWLTAGSANSDLLTTVNGLPSRYNLSDFTATGSALDYLVQNDYMVLRAVPENEDADSVLLDIDASNLSSYPRQGTTWGDISGYTNDIALTNGPSFDAATNSIIFDGTNDYGTTPNIMGGLTEYSAEFVFNARSNPSGLENWLGSQYPGTGRVIWDLFTTQTLRNFINGTGIAGNIIINTDKWYHAVFTRDAEGFATIYVNGELDRSGTISAAAVVNIHYEIGGSTTLVRWLDGKIAKNKLYNKALSETEIKQNYFGGPIVTDGLVFNIDASNLVSYENGSTSTYSLTGSFTGALLNGVGWEPGNGGVFAFDGTNDKIRFSGFPQVFGGSITMECWIWWNDDSRSIILGNYNDGQNTSINFEKLTDRKLRMYWNQGERDIFGATNSVDLNTWQHIIIQRDKDANVFRFYINGELKQTTSNAGSDVPSTGNTWYVGADARDGSTVTNGNIAALRLYNRALTAEEIGQNYNAQKQKFQF